MKLTPLEIQQMVFPMRFRGYDKKEVAAFLDTVSQEYVSLTRENTGLKEKVAELEGQVRELKQKETVLASTLISAQAIVEQMKVNAQKEAELLLKEAHAKASDIIREAHGEVARIRGDIRDLEKSRAIFMEECRSVLETFRKLLTMAEPPETDRP